MEDFARHLDDLHRQLGIPAGYAAHTGLPPQPEPDTLVTVVTEDERTHRLVPGVAARWAQMEAAAERDGLRLLLISAFRSIDYQVGIIRNKLDRGRSIDEILRENAAPGYSEHHSGRAVDIGAPGQEPLTEAFEGSPQFDWLQANAHQWGFFLSYPRDNPYGIIYEPWHWTVPNDRLG